MRPRTLALGIASILAVTPALGAQCPVGQHASGHGAALHFRASPGQTRRFLITEDESLDQTVLGQPAHVHQVWTMGVRYKVMAGTGGTLNVRMTFQLMRIRLDNGRRHIDYDSSDPNSVVPRAVAANAAMVGHSVTLRLGANGTVMALTGVDSLMSAEVESIDVPAGKRRDELMKVLRHSFEERVVGETMQPVLWVLPDRPIAVGESWTCTATIIQPPPVPVTQVSTWTVGSRSKGVATMVVSTRMRSDSTLSEPTAVGSTNFRYALHGTMAGSAEIDEKTGWVIRSSAEGDMSGTITQEGSFGRDLAIPSQFHLKIVVEPAGS